MIERTKANLCLEQEFTRLQQQQQAARQQRQSDTLAGHVLESREESLVDAQQRGVDVTSAVNDTSGPVFVMTV